ncbi:MAG: methionyl-tRNA formyltransferase, partial [Lachnospiraceae bacterium]|nr:methionyl-tRNA formyltransferase [Lachnospiraceae bacterium]
VTADQILVCCGEGLLGIRQLQLEGKKRMRTKEFLLGRALPAGMKLGQ